MSERTPCSETILVPQGGIELRVLA